MRRGVITLAALAVACVGCDDSDDKKTEAVATFAPFIAADDAWQDLEGAGTLSSVVDDSGLDEAPHIFTQSIECAGECDDSTMLIALFERPLQPQSDTVSEIQAMDIDGCSPSFIGLDCRRDGYMVQVSAGLPAELDVDSGIMITVLVLRLP